MSLMNSSRKRTTLEEFIRQVMADKTKGELTRLTLVHMVGQMPREVYGHDLGASTGTPTEWANMFEGMAHTAVQDIQGVHTFNLLAFYNGATVQERYYTIIINSQPETGGLSTENPTPEGRLQMEMRHKDIGMQQVFQQQQHLNIMSQRMIETFAGIATRSTSEKAEAYDLLFETMGKHVANQQAHELAVQKEISSRELRARLVKFLPPLANSLSGTEIFPQGTEDTVYIEMLLEKALENGEGIQGLEGLLGMLGLSDEARAALKDRAVRMLKKREAEEKKAQQAFPQGISDPESDVNGGGLRALPGGKKSGGEK